MREESEAALFMFHAFEKVPVEQKESFIKHAERPSSADSGELVVFAKLAKNICIYVGSCGKETHH